jgi:hypothetical protein
MSFRDESRGKPEWVGVNASECLSFARSRKGLLGKAKAKTGIEKFDLPGL